MDRLNEVPCQLLRIVCQNLLLPDLTALSAVRFSDIRGHPLFLNINR